MLRKSLSFIWAVLLCILLMSGAVYANDVATEETPLFTGAGTVESPYEISTPDDFLALAEKVNSGDTAYADAYYKLTKSVDLEGVSYVPVGTAEYPFTGVFDGGKYIISNLTITEAYEYAGLFGVTVNADVKNVVVKNASIDISVVDAVVIVGIVCGYNSVEFTTDTHYFTDCSVEGTVTLSAETLNTSIGSATAGGVIGKSETHNNSKLIISNCNADVDITVTSAFSAFAGGILGVSKSSHTGGSNITTASNCVATGNITASANGSWVDAGGIAGWFSQQELGWTDEHKEDSELAALLASQAYINLENCVSDCVVSAVAKNDKPGSTGVMCAEVSGDFKHGENAINSDNPLQESESGYNGTPVETAALFTEAYLTDTFGYDFENVWEFVLSKPVLKTASPYIAAEYDAETAILRVAPVNCGACDIYAIAYTSDGRVATSRGIPYNGTDAEVNPDFAGVEFDYIRVFALGANLNPICVPKQINID